MGSLLKLGGRPRNMGRSRVDSLQDTCIIPVNIFLGLSTPQLVSHKPFCNRGHTSQLLPQEVSWLILHRSQFLMPSYEFSLIYKTQTFRGRPSIKRTQQFAKKSEIPVISGHIANSLLLGRKDFNICETFNLLVFMGRKRRRLILHLSLEFVWNKTISGENPNQKLYRWMFQNGDL